MQNRTFFNSFLLTLMTLSALSGAGCTYNEATGEKQFTGLMPAQSEESVGAAEHEKIIKEYGGLYADQRVQAYANQLGQRIAKNTERTDVTYKFFVLDSPVVNAFALPGGYVYMTRGLMAVANDEAELAGVIAHEIGHVTARHQAQRYSQGFLTQLGATVLSAAVGNAQISQAVDLGSNLYMSSYSRGQESQADELGVRYLSRAGYDTMAMADFLDHMERYNSTESAAEGKQEQSAGYFSTHPPTPQRVREAIQLAGQYPASTKRNRSEYQSVLAGLTYGAGWKEGFVKGNTFYHPSLGFQFTVPSGYKIDNQSSKVVASGADGGLIVFDMASSRSSSPERYMADEWLAGKMNAAPEAIKISGMPAAAAGFEGMIGGRPARVQMVAIQWSSSDVYRFQIAFPEGAGAQTIDGLKRATYSFRPMSKEDQARVRPQKIGLIRASATDTVQTMAGEMNVPQAKVERFLALNGLSSNAKVVAGQIYKVVE